MPLLAAIRDLVSRELLRALISKTTHERTPREVRVSFSRELDYQNFRGQRNFPPLFINAKSFSYTNVNFCHISVIFEVFRDLFRAIKRDQPLGARKETHLEVWRRHEWNSSMIII